MTLTKAELADLLKIRPEQARGQGHGRGVLRRSGERSSAARASSSGLRQLPAPRQPQRPGRNPKTGEEIPISARRVVTFHASQKLKAMVEKARHGAKSQES